MDKWRPFSSACFLFFSSDSAVFIFQTLLADFKDPMGSRHMVPTTWVELYIARAPLFFYFNVIHREIIYMVIVYVINDYSPSYNMIICIYYSLLFLYSIYFNSMEILPEKWVTKCFVYRTENIKSMISKLFMRDYNYPSK